MDNPWLSLDPDLPSEDFGESARAPDPAQELPSHAGSAQDALCAQIIADTSNPVEREKIARGALGGPLARRLAAWALEQARERATSTTDRALTDTLKSWEAAIERCEEALGRFPSFGELAHAAGRSKTAAVAAVTRLRALGRLRQSTAPEE